MSGRHATAVGRGLRAAACLAAAAFVAACSPPKAPQPPSTIAGNDTVTVFDHHVHILSPALIERWRTGGVPFSKPDYAYSDIDSIMKFNPADGMFLVSMAYLWSTPAFSDSAERSHVERENDFVAGLARRHPGRLFGFCAVDPLAPYALDEFLRCCGTPGIDGLKLHLPTSGVDLSDPGHLARVRELLSAASSRRIPVMLHIEPPPGASPERGAAFLIDSLLAPLPPVEVYLAHLGTSNGYTLATRALVLAFGEALRSRPELRKHTIRFDLSGVAMTEGSGQVPALTPQDFTELAGDLRMLGLDRVVFGTDYPAFNTVAYMATLERELPLTREELVGIAGNGLPAGFRPARAAER